MIEDDSLVTQYYDDTAREYDASYDTPYWRLYHAITWANIRRFLPPSKDAKVLDAGGGTGYWAIRLAQQDYSVVLTDLSGNMLRVANEKIEAAKLQDKIDTRRVDIRDMACFAPDQFDVVLAEGDPVSYCLQPERAVRELARVVKPNCHVIVSVDNKYTAMLSLLRHQAFTEVATLYDTGLLHGNFPVQAFTPEELRQLFESCGLTVVRLIGKPVLTQLVSRFLPREQRNAMIKENFQAFLDLELRFCETQSLVGVGGHLEIVGLKPKPQ